jgi:hypothetical protein
MMAYISTAELVNAAKNELGIDKPNDQMDDAEIRQVTRLIGRWTNGPVNLLAMLTITAVEFPKFFTRYELSHPN